MQAIDPKKSKQLLASQYYTAPQLIKLYWQSEHRFSAYFILAIVMFMTVCLVGFDVAFSYWFNYFYDALQAYNKQSAIYLLLIFFALAGVNIIVIVYRYYLSQFFGLRWRQWLTTQLIERWLQNKDYYYLEMFDERTDNPDQRLQEDVGSLVTLSINLFIGLMSAITTFIAFIYVLWQLSGSLHFSLGALGEWHIHGYLVWVAILYSLIGTFFAFKIGYPLISLNFEQQRREATFRFAAVDLRSHAEDVALYRGEEHEKSILGKLFDGVLKNWYLIILRQKLLLWFTSGYNQIAVALPLLVALPNYFGKVFLLGGLMQTLRAFSSIQDALSFLVNAYPQIAEWRAVNQRLITLINHMQVVDEKMKHQNQLIFESHDSAEINIHHLSIFMPTGEPLLKAIQLKLVHGKNYLIKGDSGIGKSTFVRVVAGIWPFAKGKIDLPAGHNIMYVPQKPYMPMGTLAEAISFPDKTHPEFEMRLAAILKDCHLEHLIPKLQETAAWSEQLSPGEQQRIAFARILLHRPDWVFLDESTSMLDLKNEAHLYRLLSAELPHCSLISVGHHLSLEIFHEQVIDMTAYRAE